MFWFITLCCCFCICWFHCSSCFSFFILCWLGAPKNYPLPLLQNMFFFLFRYVWKCGDLFSLQRNPILNISGWNLQIHFSTKGFTLAQKITSDPHISKESDIHHSQNNEETFEKLFAKKTCNSKNPKETNMEKHSVFGLNCWKYSLVKKNKVSNKTVFRLLTSCNIFVIFFKSLWISRGESL